MPPLLVGEAEKGDLLVRNAEPGRRIELLSPDYKAGLTTLRSCPGVRVRGLNSDSVDS